MDDFKLAVYFSNQQYLYPRHLCRGVCSFRLSVHMFHLFGRTFRGLRGIFLSKIRFAPLRIHYLALTPIFCLHFRGYLSMGV